MKEKDNRDRPGPINEYLQRNQYKKLEIIFEENNSLANDLNNPDMSGARTQRNFYKKYNPLQEDRKEKIRNKNKSNEKLRNVNYNKDYNNNDQEQEEDSDDREFHKIEGNKRNQKVNQNLKLLRLIKEKYNNNSGKKEKEKEQNDKLDDDEENNNIQEKSRNPNKNKYLKRKGFASFIINKKTNGNDNENKNKKLNDSQNQRINKFKKREIDVVVKDEEEIYHKENKIKNKSKTKSKSKSKSKSNSKNLSRNRSRRGGNSKNKKNDYNVGSASQSSFVRKGVGIFEISTPNSKVSQIKIEDKEKEKENKNELKIEKNDKKEEKYTEIPNSQRDKLTINIKPKNDNYINNSNNTKKKVNQNSNIGKNNSYTYDRDDDINVNDFNDNVRNDFNESYLVDGTNEESESKNINEKSRDINTNYRRKKNYSNIETVIEKLSIKETINNSPNNDNSSSKKEGALKILELLKAKKKEQNKSQYSLSKKSQDTPVKQENSHRINYNESEVDKTKDEVDIQKTKDTTKNTDSSHISNQQKTNKNYAEGKFDINSLPKKTFRDEEDEDDNNYKYNDSNTKSQQTKKPKTNFNRIENRKKNLINRNRSMNINNYLDLEEEQNSSERKISNYIINSSSLRTKYNKRTKDPSSTTENFNISLSPRGLESQNINSYNSIIKNNVNIKALDKSFDMSRSRQSPLSKKLLNINTNEPNAINVNSNSGIYEPKKISSPRNKNKRNLNNDFNNINYMNSMKNIRNNANTKIYNKVNSNNQSYIAYIKKSPGRFKANKNNSNDNIERPKNKRNNLYKNNTNSNNVNNVNTVNNVNVKNNSRNNVPGLIEVSSIDKINSSKDSCTSNTIDYINNNRNNFVNKRNKNNNGVKSNLTETQKENSIMFNLEDLMVLEERLNDINLALESNNNIDNKCFNFWNYYYNCSLYKLLEKIFPNEEDSNAIRLSINYELMSIMVCYEFSFHECISIEDMYLKLLELININHNNLMIISQYILTKISPENKDNIWVLKLQELVNNLKISQVKELNNNYTLSPIQKINNNINILIPKIKDILLNYKTEYSPLLKDYLPSIESKTYEEINDFFRLNILRVDNFEGSIVASSYLKEKKDFESVPAPYIKEPSKKKYTLVLDLDETLVNFKIKSNKEGILRARPFLFGFLEEMGVYYELIVWTSATEAYANTLLDAIECEKTYFDYVFYREHAIIVGDDFVKDLNRIGRPLDRVIIVDDMPQNFRLQRQNGITIKPFLGDDNSDMALYYLLPILKNIAEEGNDVRVELAKYRDEIVKKITSNISKHNI